MSGKPIDMVLHCPNCGMQHIDEPDAGSFMLAEDAAQYGAGHWTNPPHRSHLCHGCKHVWRPADVPTNGVAAVKTQGKADSPVAGRQPSQAPVVQAGNASAPAVRTPKEVHVQADTIEDIKRAFSELSADKRIPADGKIGGVL